MPSMTKIWVAPESAIASFDAIVIAAYAHFDSCRGANEENADSRLFVEPSVLEIMSPAIKRFVDGPMEGHRTKKGHLSYRRITQTVD